MNPVHWKFTKKAISITLIFVLVLLSAAQFAKFNKANAGTFTDAKLTISDSRANLASVTYVFSMAPTATTAIKQVDIYFCTTAVYVPGDCVAPAALDTGTPTLSADDIDDTGAAPTVTKIAAADNTIRVVTDTPGTQNTTPMTMTFTGVHNTSDDDSSFYALVTTYSDTGSTTIDRAIVASAVLGTGSLAVSASIGPAFTFTVTGVTSSSLVNGATTTVETQATTIPFGQLTIGTQAIAAHDLNIKTNATNGYQITVKTLADPPLSDSTENIDFFTGTNDSPTDWSEPTSSTASDNTGFFGYTTNDASLTVTGDGADRFTNGGPDWAGFTTSPAEVAYRGTAPGTGAGETTRVGWSVEVDSYQPPGNYTGTVVLVATPTY